MTPAPSFSTLPFHMGLGGWGWGTGVLLPKRSPVSNRERHLWVGDGSRLKSEGNRGSERVAAVV